MRARWTVRACLLVVAVSAGAAAVAADWPQWRGPSRDGTAPQVTSRWPASLERAWSAVVGEGHASPVIVGDRVFVHTRQGEDEVVRALDRASGRELWQQKDRVPYAAHPAARSHGAGPKSTPAVAGGRVVTFSITGTVSARDAALGTLRWRQDFAGRFAEAQPTYGAALSPLVAGGLVIVHAGGSGGGALVALDEASGAERWAWPGDGPGYASPMVATLGGVRQVVTLTESRLAGIALADGTLLWDVPVKTPYDQNAVTPLVVGDLVVYSGLDQGIGAVRPRRAGTRWTAERVWHTAEFGLYMSAPVAAGGRVIGLSHKKRGQLFALDGATGRAVWTGDGRQGDNAALAVAGDDLVVLTTDAELFVAPARADRFRPAATYTVADTPTWASPALAPGLVVVKDEARLTAWRIP